MNICIYGTVYNSVNTQLNTIKSNFEFEFSAIVAIDSYSTDGIYERLKQIEKEFSFTTRRYLNYTALKEKSFQYWIEKKLTFYSHRYELILELISS
jgi:hypothetical protein